MADLVRRTLTPTKLHSTPQDTCCAVVSSFTLSGCSQLPTAKNRECLCLKGGRDVRSPLDVLETAGGRQVGGRQETGTSIHLPLSETTP
jgi:hypothetical protein